MKKKIKTFEEWQQDVWNNDCTIKKRKKKLLNVKVDTVITFLVGTAFGISLITLIMYL